MNKLDVKDRMLAFCASTIGYKNVDLVDPILKLFIEALSEEIYQVKGEIDALEERIINLIGMYLVPDVSLLAKPAHSVVRLEPSDLGQKLTVSKDNGFVTKRNSTELEFYPLGDLQLLDAKVQCIEVGGKLLKYSSYSKNFELIAKDLGSYNTLSVDRDLWIAIDLNQSSPKDIKDLTLFFDFLNTQNKKLLLDLLFYATWRIDKERLVLKRGKRFINKKLENHIELIESFEPYFEMHKNIEEHYNDQFITIKNFSDLDVQTYKYPKEFENIYSKEILSELGLDDMLWVKIELPDGFDFTVFNNLNVSLNCIPLINKAKRTISIEPNEVTKIIKLPIDKESYFLAIDSVKDSSGKSYYDVQYKNTDEQEYGTYTLRKAGYEKYGSNDAKDYLEGLGEFLLVESHKIASGASSDENARKVYNILQDMIEYIQSMTITTKQKMEHQIYIVFDQYIKDEIYYIDYWTTAGEKANVIDSSSLLVVSHDSKLELGSISLQTDFILGNNEPNAIEKRQRQKEALDKINVIVNDIDISTFCKTRFKHSIDDVKVKRGIEYTEEEGFIKTIEVYLKPKDNLGHFLTQKNIIWFKNQLEKVSPEHFQYRVFLAS